MKKDKFIEEIIQNMHDVGFTTPFSCEGTDEETIIGKLKRAENIELRDRDGRTPLIGAAFYHRIESLKYLLDRGCDINAQDNIGFAALHAAVYTGDIEITKILLEHGADVNIRDEYGNTPMLRCEGDNVEDLYRLLLKHGADPSIQNNYGVSVYDYFEMTKPELLSLLPPIEETR